MVFFRPPTQLSIKEEMKRLFAECSKTPEVWYGMGMVEMLGFEAVQAAGQQGATDPFRAMREYMAGANQKKEPEAGDDATLDMIFPILEESLRKRDNLQDTIDDLLKKFTITIR